MRWQHDRDFLVLGRPVCLPVTPMQKKRPRVHEGLLYKVELKSEEREPQAKRCRLLLMTLVICYSCATGEATINSPALLTQTPTYAETLVP